MFFKKVFVPWLLLFTTVSPNIGWVLAGVSKADYHTEPSFLRNKISTEEMGTRWDVCLCLGENSGGPPRWKGQDEQREGGRETEPGLSRKESLSVLGSVIRDQCGRWQAWPDHSPAEMRKADPEAWPLDSCACDWLTHTHTHLGEGLLPNSTLTMEFLSVLFKQKLKSI